MLITCPHCSFARNVPDDKLPATAEMATCPKCRHKFRFRSLDGPAFDFFATDSTPQDSEEPLAHGHATAPGETLPGTRTDNEAALDDPGEHSALPGDGSPHASAESNDIWQSLESMPRPGTAPTAAHEEEPGAASSRDSGSEPLDQPGTDFPDFSQTSFGHSSNKAHASSPDANDSAGDAAGEVPWENLETHGFYKGFFLTMRLVMLHAPWFFRQMPLTRGMVKPLSFFLLVAQVQYVAQFMWEKLGLFSAGLPTGEVPSNMAGVSGMGGDILQLFVMYPLMTVGLLFLAAGLNHLFLILFQGASKGFEATFKAVAYASAPQILGIIPVVGPLVGAFWSLVCTVIAYRLVHKTSSARVIAALLAPMVMVALALILAAIAGQKM